MHSRKLRELGTSDCGVNIPREILKAAGLAAPDDSDALLREQPQVFIHYDPETREVSFTLPKPDEATDAGVRKAVQEEIDRRREGKQIGFTEEDRQRVARPEVR